MHKTDLITKKVSICMTLRCKPLTRNFLEKGQFEFLATKEFHMLVLKVQKMYVICTARTAKTVAMSHCVSIL